MDVTVENKKVTIKAIYQWRTYSGLLMGLPTKKMNARIIESAKKSAQNFTGLQEVYLIEPQQKLLSKRRPYPFGIPASLPSTICIVELWHSKALRDENKHYSSLAVVWFQDEFAFPIAETILEKMELIPWESIAGEFEY